jgi:hypothetical protein
VDIQFVVRYFESITIYESIDGIIHLRVVLLCDLNVLKLDIS